MKNPKWGPNGMLTIERDDGSVVAIDDPNGERGQMIRGEWYTIYRNAIRGDYGMIAPYVAEKNPTAEEVEQQRALEEEERLIDARGRQILRRMAIAEIEEERRRGR